MNSNEKKAPSTLLTEGVIWKKLLTFAFPLFLGHLFQQFYNMADSLIVGNYIGSDALAAVSSSGSVIFLLVGFFGGISAGAGVVIAKYYGARDEENIKRSIHTTVAFGIVAGIAMTIIGVILTPWILIWMDTPADVLPSSILYFRTYFCGSIAFVLYNVFVGILQAVGNSRRPLIYLIISSLVNVGLDYFFIAVLHLGVGFAAFATVISQFVSATLCFIHLVRCKTDYRINVREIRFNKPMLKLILRNGLPAGLQNSIISFANIVVQSNINAFGKIAVAGCGSYSKIEGFAFLPINCFSMALATFVSQNLGAAKYDRVKKGTRIGIFCSITLAETIGLVVYQFAPVFLSAFGNNPEVIQYGTMQARTVSLFYCLLAFSHCLAGIFRGAGRSTVPMFVMLICWCLIRVSYITVIVHFIPKIQVIFWAYPLTWSLSSIIFIIYYFKANWMSIKQNK